MKSSKWVFSYGLSEKINCKKDIPRRKYVKFQTEMDGETEQKISGFSITVCGASQKEAQVDADKRARNLINLLAASSRTFSDFYSAGYQEVGRNTGHTVTPQILVNTQFHVLLKCPYLFPYASEISEVAPF